MADSTCTTLLHGHILASEAGTSLDKILDPHLISLHIHSMWETICDAVASSSGINLRSKPYSPQKTHPQMKSCQIWGTLDLTCPEYLRSPLKGGSGSPPPPKMKSCQIWDLPKGGSGSSYVGTNLCIPRGYHLVMAQCTQRPVICDTLCALI